MKTIILIATFLIAASVGVLAQGDIHSVDFMNFTYAPSCAGEDTTKVKVTKGEFSSEKEVDGIADRFYFNVMSVKYGDLNADKQDEAVILSVCNTGGTGQFTEGFIYTMKAGKPTLIARVPGGDRADGGLRSLVVDGGLLVIEANDGARNSGACCPEGTVTEKVRLVGDKLIEASKPVRRELYPKERLAFAKGASEKTFTITIAPDDRKRYTVGARAGQVLSVRSSTGDATLSLMGDTDTTEGTNSLSAKLPITGDYTFEVSNYGEKPIEVTVRVSIK